MVEKGYIDFLYEMLTAKYPESTVNFVNCGIPGDTARGGLWRLEQDVVRHNPDLVFIQFALNDAFTGCSPDQYERNIRAIVERIRTETGSDILLVTSVAPGNDYDDLEAEKFYERLQMVSETENIPIAGVHEYWKKKISSGIPHSSLVQADQVHPTVDGYRLMAEAIMLSL